MNKMHIWSKEAQITNGYIYSSATIETSNEPKFDLWYRCPIEYQDYLIDSCDSFVIATIFLAMNQDTDLFVHGSVSSSLIKNLDEFQVAWSCWKPHIYRRINIQADKEREYEKVEREKVAISAFSGGVDSCYTAFQHAKKINSKYNLQACLMVHGFDIPIQRQEEFERAFYKSKKITSSLELELIPLATNFRQVIKLNWEDVHGVAIASCFHLLSRVYNVGIIASSYSALDLKGYDVNTLPSSYSHRNAYFAWGSNPLTDLFLSSQSLQIVHDGCGLSRLQKISTMLDWQEFLINSRVCWQGKRKDCNCGCCEKCARTILCFRILGYGLPPCFQDDITDKQLMNLKLRGSSLSEMQNLVTEVKMTRPSLSSSSWIRVLEKVIKRNKILELMKIPAKMKKKLLSMLSKFSFDRFT